MDYYPFLNEALHNQNGTVMLRLFDLTLRRSAPEPPPAPGCFQVMMVKESACTLHINDRDCPIKENDCLIFSAQDRPVLFPLDHDCTFSVLRIFPKAFTEAMPSSRLFDEANMLHEHSESFDPLIPGNHAVSLGIQEHLASLHRLFLQKDTGYELSVMSLVMDLLLLLVRHTDYCRDRIRITEQHGSKRQLSALNRSLAYISAHLSEELTLEKLAQVSGLSPNYLSSVFRNQTGVRLWDHITEKRIALATKLFIENPTDSVITIAMKCGFNNCPNFNRAFKKYTGMTPLRFKAGIIKQENDQ